MRIILGGLKQEDESYQNQDGHQDNVEPRHLGH